MKKNTLTLAVMALVCASTFSKAHAQNTSPYWSLAGNSNASASSKLGTTNAIPLRLMTNNITRVYITPKVGYIGMGTTNPTDRLHINSDSGKNALRVQVHGSTKLLVHSNGGVAVGSGATPPIFGLYVKGNVGIGTPIPAASALFEARSTTQGVLLPRMTTAQKNAISLPEAGLLVYQTDSVKGFYYYDTKWKLLGAASVTSGANTSLSNLTTTAINQSLLPASNNKLQLGSSEKGWVNIFITDGLYLGGNRFLWRPGTAAMENTAVGVNALNGSSSGGYNTAIGSGALMGNSIGESNTAVGRYSLFNNNASYNTAVGERALVRNTEGEYNTAIGPGSLFYNKSGSQNTAIGPDALVGTQYGDNNTALGFKSLRNGRYNLEEDADGSNNTAVGALALTDFESGNDNTALGAFTVIGTDNENSTVIGFGATAMASNQVRVGNTAVTSIGGYASWTNFSDGRYKQNVKENVPGLDFITKLRPVTYTLDVTGIEKTIKADRPAAKSEHTTAYIVKGTLTDHPVTSAQASTNSAVQGKSMEAMAEAQTAKAKIVYTGFVAQEVEAAAEKLDYDFSGVDKPKNNKDFYGLRYAEFVVPLVKSVQELDAENKDLKKQLASLQQQLNEVKDLVAKLVNGQTVTSIPPSKNLGSLEQNTPNPVSNTTAIKYHIPQAATSATLNITNAKGQLVKTLSLGNSTTGQVNVNTSMLAAGTYNYTLYVDEKQVDTKRMVVTH